MKDSRGRFTLANDATARASCLERGDRMIGKTDFDFFAKDEARRYHDEEQEVLATGRAMVNQESWAGGSDGRQGAEKGTFYFSEK
jgi:PAS domain-containing protein